MFLRVKMNPRGPMPGYGNEKIKIIREYLKKNYSMNAGTKLKIPPPFYSAKS